MIRRRTVLSAFAGLLGLLAAGSDLRAADVSEIRLDWATYNPVSLVLKEKGFLEEALKARGIKVRWVQSLGSNKALEFLNGSAIDFGSSAGAAALLARINGNPVKVVYAYSRPEWTALVTRPDIVFADEPTGNLDSEASAEVLGHLRRSVRELGMTVVMVTHELDAAAYADDVVVIHDGTVTAHLSEPGQDELVAALRGRGA